MPVTTPIAKLTRKSLPQNFVWRSQRSSPVRYQAGLKDRDDERQPDRQRDEQEVVDGRDPELPTGNVDGVHHCSPGEESGPEVMVRDRGARWQSRPSRLQGLWPRGYTKGTVRALGMLVLPRRSRTAVAVLAVVMTASALTVGGAPAARATIRATGDFGCPGYGGLNHVNPAAAVMQDRIVVPGFAAVTVGRGDDVDWRLDPYRHRTWVLQFRSLRWLGSLLDDYRRTGDRVSLAHAVGVTKDWVHDNPPPTYDAGTVEGTAHRVDFLLCLLDVAGPQQWLAHTLDAEATVLRGHFSGKYNHGLDEALALYGIGCELGRMNDRVLARAACCATSRPTWSTSRASPTSRRPATTRTCTASWPTPMPACTAAAPRCRHRSGRGTG